MASAVGVPWPISQCGTSTVTRFWPTWSEEGVQVTSPVEAPTAIPAGRALNEKRISSPSGSKARDVTFSSL